MKSFFHLSYYLQNTINDVLYESQCCFCETLYIYIYIYIYTEITIAVLLKDSFWRTNFILKIVFKNQTKIREYSGNFLTLLPPSRHFVNCPTLTLSQWSSSGNPVAIQCTWNLDSSVHWNATGERIVGIQCAASGLPVAFQWSSSVFQLCKFKTGSPLGHHWVLPSASVVPVASQCTLGSSGLPVWSVQWYPNVLTKSGLEVIRSGHFPACDPLCIQLVWWELLELNWFHLTCNPNYTKTIMVLISKACKV